jgi:hypothetical protein
MEATQELSEIFPWLLKRESSIFEAFDKLHVVFRVGRGDPVVIREGEYTLTNTKTYLNSLINAGGSVIELLELCTIDSDLKRAINKGGAVVFRSLRDLPKELDQSDIISLSEALEIY